MPRKVARENRIESNRTRSGETEVQERNFKRKRKAVEL